MWSGPRNISTAMMRAWENRSDTRVIDEPFYAHYLAHTGIDHPMAAEIVACGETDWRRIIGCITARPERGIFYQKHITTHLLPHIELRFLEALSHVFLIRDPRAVVASYSHKRPSVTAQDLGYRQQRELFERVCELQGEAPPVIDSALFLQDPRGQLEALCSSLDVAFDTDMLEWPAGERTSDGIWHHHWYDAVKRSTGFKRPVQVAPENGATLQRSDAGAHSLAECRTAEAASPETDEVVAACLPAYEALRPFAIAARA